MKWLTKLWALSLIVVMICCSSGGSTPQAGGGEAGEGGAAGSSGRAPTADAGPAQKVDVGAQVTLDGSASTDPNGAMLTFAWKVVSEPVGAKVTLSNPSAVRPKFKVPQEGSYVFELVVSNDNSSSAPARVSVSTTGNRPPIARAGEDIAAKVGDEVKLDGSESSDPDGDKITYAWRFKSRPKGSKAELSDDSMLAPQFKLDVSGDYVLELVVNDGALDSDPAEVIVSTGNLAPRAVIAVKTDPVLVAGDVSLDGTGSHDANGDKLSYSWSVTSQPEGSTPALKSADEPKATFAPDVRGDYVVQLIVNDGTVDSKPTTALITPENRKPTANAGVDANAGLGQAFTLDGSGSSDPDHDALHYTWKFETLPEGSAAALAAADTVSPSFAPDVAGPYVIDLTVNDGDESSDVARVTVTASLASAGPTITGFSPVSGPAGTLVTVTGSGFTSMDGSVHVYVTTPSGVVEATVVSVTDGEIKFILPPGAITGTISIQVGGQKATSATPLTVDPSAKFELAVEPSTVSLNPGVSVSAIVRLSTTTSFADLADLTIEGLPAGVSAKFTPQKIRAGDWSLLTLQAAATQAANQLALTVRASAEIDDASHSELGSLAVNVAQVTTAFVGRTVLDDPRETPLTGATVTLLGKDGNAGSTNCQGTTVSDAAGNFAFTNLPAGCTGTQLVRFNGLTVTNPAGKYSGVDLANNIPPGVATQAPALIHLPRVDTAPTVGVKQNATTDQILTFPGIPNMDVTIYAGTTLTMPDGTKPDPFPLTAIPVPVDRLPEEVPHTQAGFHFFIVAFQPAGGIASQPIAVSYPNLLAYPPSTAMNLLTLDPDKGVMVQYGTSKVSDDGLKIVPDADPNHAGHKFGIVHLDWHLPFINIAPAVPAATGGAGTGCPGVASTHNSVDFATGLEHRESTDIAVNGPRGGMAITRMYRTFNTNNGPFGVGTSHNYHYQLSVAALTGTTFNYIPPNGNVIPFVRQTNGTYINQTDSSLVGAVFSTVAGGSQLRLADGTLLGFQAFTRMGGSMLTTITDPNSNTVTITRSTFTPLDVTAVTDPVGRQLTFTYDASGRVTGITDPLGRTVSYSYGTDGNLSTFTDVRGKVTQYTYTAKGQLATITDPRNVKVLELTYDANGRASSETVVGSGKTTFDYTLINTSVPLSPVVETKVTDPLGNVSDYRFNPRGFLLSASDPLGQTNTLNREAGTNRILETLGSGVCGSCGGAGHQLFEYNSFGQMVKQTDELGGVTQTQYTGAFSRPSSVTDPLGNVTTMTYDARGNLTQVKDALQHTSSFEYDAHGQVTAVVDVDGTRSAMTYDGAGNLSSLTDAAGNVTRVRYDAISRPIETTDALGRRSTTQYDSANHVIQTTDASGAITKFSYDEIGNLLSVTDARGAVTQYAYDTAGRLATRTDPMQGAEQFAYDAVGRLSQHIDRRGLAATFAYDTLHRLTSATYADSTVAYRYDAQGNVAGVTDSLAGEYRFGYDVRNLLTSSQGPSGSLSYTRDLLGRVTAESILGQPDALYSYNAAGQYTRIETQGAGVSYGYDAAGRVKTETRDNNVITHYSYDTLGAVTGVQHELSGTNIDLQAYEHDAAGATTHAEDSLQGSVATPETTASYDLGNRIQTWGSKTFTHDKEGNRLSAVEGSSTESYAWDARGRLKSITQADGTVIKLSYDFAGNLARISSPAGDETQLTDASGNVVLRRTAKGTIQRMLSGLAMDHQVALLDSAQGVRYPLATQPNTTVATVDGKGLVDGQYSYEPYGATSVTQAAKADYPFLFTGRTRVTDGLYYYRARFLDPVTSRFVSEDPLGFGGGGPNVYSYVGERPLDRLDPNGKNPVIIIAAVAGAALGVGAQYLSNRLTGCEGGYLKAAGVGALTGVAALYLNPVVLGYLAGGLGDAVQQIGNGKAFSWGEVGFSATVGGVLGIFGSQASVLSSRFERDATRLAGQILNGYGPREFLATHAAMLTDLYLGTGFPGAVVGSIAGADYTLETERHVRH
jgi:RHS repeat-associated protein